MPHIVYKIFSEKGDKVYYGSTITHKNPIQRFHQHRAEYRTGVLRCSSKILFDEYGIDSCIYQIIEDCDTVEHTREREKWWILNNPCVNKITPVPTVDEIRHKCQTYRNEHKIRKKTYDVEYRNKTKEIREEKHICGTCGGKYILKHMTTHNKTKRHLKNIIQE